MAYQESFTPKEWTTIQFAPLWVFSAVAGSDGKFDKKELKALAELMASGPLLRNALARESFVGITGNMARIMQSYTDDGRSWLAGLGQVADLLDRKVGPEMADEFKKTLLAMGVKIADASGGIFGFGSRISEQEKTALTLVAHTLRVSFAS